MGGGRAPPREEQERVTEQAEYLSQGLARLRAALAADTTPRLESAGQESGARGASRLPSARLHATLQRVPSLELHAVVGAELGLPHALVARMKRCEM